MRHRPQSMLHGKWVVQDVVFVQTHKVSVPHTLVEVAEVVDPRRLLRTQKKSTVKIVVVSLVTIPGVGCGYEHTGFTLALL